MLRVAIRQLSSEHLIRGAPFYAPSAPREPLGWSRLAHDLGAPESI